MSREQGEILREEISMRREKVEVIREEGRILGDIIGEIYLSVGNRFAPGLSPGGPGCREFTTC